MSAVSFHRENEQYTYGLESPTCLPKLKLMISQFDGKLSISIKNELGTIFPVEGSRLRGLPATKNVPRAFFENAYSVAQQGSDGAYSVTFSTRGLGGWKPSRPQFTTSGGATLRFTLISDSNFNSLTGKQGLYIFINARCKKGTYSYVGESENLGGRLDGHEQLAKNDYVYFHQLSDNINKETRKMIEAEMIKKLCPIRNNQHTGECSS